MKPCGSFAVAAIALFVMLMSSTRSVNAQEIDGEPREGTESRPTGAELAPTPAPDVAERREVAKRHFFLGIEHFENEEVDAALAEFLHSREIYPGVAATKNAALALSRLGRNAEALLMYQALIAEFPGTLREDELALVQRRIAGLRRSVGEILVDGAFHGAIVIVDGSERGSVPLPGSIFVDAGTHTVRVYKTGFVPFEAQVFVAGQQRKVVRARLTALRRSGKLRVLESDGRRLDVVLDGAVVGKTPWEGIVTTGSHAVALRGGPRVGTPPSAARIVVDQTTTLRLRATTLDSELRIEPTPTNARVDLDSVNLGGGVWQGKVQSGSHRIEISADGFLAYRADVTVLPGRRRLVRVALERDRTDPRWKEAFWRRLFVEALAGPTWASGLGGAADAACSRGECSDRSGPFGVAGGVRSGYEIVGGLAVELLVGALYLEERMTRNVTPMTEPTVTLESTDYEDTTRLVGPMAAASVSYRFFEQTPLTVRMWAGAARVRASFTNEGTFAGEMAPPTGASVPLSEKISIPEEAQHVWIGVFGPELRFGYRVDERFSVDVGLATLLMVAPDSLRTGVSSDEGQRRVPLTDPAPGQRTGLLDLPRERGLGTFLSIAPSVGVRLDF